MADGYFSGVAQLNGELRVGTGAITNLQISAGAAITRTKLAQQNLQEYAIDLAVSSSGLAGFADLAGFTGFADESGERIV